MNPAILESEHIQTLLDVLRKRGYQIIGPTLGEGAIVYNDLNSTANLPIGWTDEQDGGTYRLKKRKDKAFFGYNVGPHSWKKYLLPSELRLWKIKRNSSSFQIVTENEAIRKFAFIGVRSCDIHAISIQDKVFMNGQYIDQHYKSRRKDTFIVAVNCGKAGGTCFCVSMNTGPRATFGFDLAMTEILEGENHCFLVETGTELGAEILREIPHKEAREKEKSVADDVMKKTAEQMGRSVDTSNIKELFYRNYEHPRGNNVAERCLTCANCTMVCPTCFCTTVEEVTDLTGEHAERWRKLGLMFYHRFFLYSRRKRPFICKIQISPMDNAQTSHMDRSIRHIGLRWLRTVHNMVPGCN